MFFFLVDTENNYLILCQFGYFLSRIPFLRYLTSTFRGFDLDLRLLIFDLQKSSEVKNIPAIRDPTQDFLSDFYWHFPSISYRFWDIQHQIKVWPWPLTFKGHLRLKIFSPFESPYMTSYLTIYWHFLSISGVFRDIWLQRFKGLTLTSDL